MSDFETELDAKIQELQTTFFAAGYIARIRETNPRKLQTETGQDAALRDAMAAYETANDLRRKPSKQKSKFLRSIAPLFASS